VSSPPAGISPEQRDACRAFQRAVPALMDDLGMPSGASWRKVTLDGPITKGSESVTIFTQRAEHVEGQPLPTSLLLPDWEGYTFELFGCIPDDPSGRENWPGWEIDDTVLQVWLQLAYVPGAPVHARIEWHPNTGILSSLQVIRDDWTSDDLSKAGRVLRLLQKLAPVTRGHRRRLEENDDSGWAELAEEAIEYMKRPGATLRRAVQHVGMLSDDLDDELDDLAYADGAKRREEAARKRLQRYVKRFKETRP
jgi:hypothetical protein